ncbi:PrpR N-terminal domain-containing protein [Oscillospiraceae bacterium LTW-04]|nr:PrpR N-terminal domain-containing protein [Oscillospiraceae bacterium MB24-C1]
MDNSILFIIPNTKMIDIIRELLKSKGFNYPVYYGSMGEALKIATDMISKGTRVVVSIGTTARFLQKQLLIPVLEMTFGGMEFITAINEAL